MWTLHPYLKKLLAQIDALYPQRNKASDGTIGNALHATTKSDHNPDVYRVVNAIDITHDPKNGCDVGLISERLRASRDPRIKYVIFNGRIFSSTVRPWEWRQYSGTSPHDHHMHVSVGGDIVPWQI